MALALAASYFSSTRDLARRRYEQMILLVVLAAVGLIVAVTSLETAPDRREALLPGQDLLDIPPQRI